MTQQNPSSGESLRCTDPSKEYTWSTVSGQESPAAMPSLSTNTSETCTPPRSWLAADAYAPLTTPQWYGWYKGFVSWVRSLSTAHQPSLARQLRSSEAPLLPPQSPPQPPRTHGPFLVWVPFVPPAPIRMLSENLADPRRGRMNPVGKAVASPLGFHPASDDPASRCQWQGGGNTEGRAPGQGSTGTLQPSLPAPVLSVGLLLCWPWRVFLAASFGVLCALPVFLTVVEAS
uniref:Macaca fascicularis brain cDNA clone: QflA-22544, similar to human small nuclear ribonucleoprotein 70kDa polypeptide (RNPantigen) (SNRP70), mRNA, RefSeq: NM_003089.3 n=1 Tax=Macaca fascicularis TaxID=9541 RepID=I7G7E0_MACFA|nr:unnamed protein product [Macaca fascicularis]